VLCPFPEASTELAFEPEIVMVEILVGSEILSMFTAMACPPSSAPETITSAGELPGIQDAL
jgi:hypothetical protein